MSAEFTDKNLIEAFCKAVSCTGLGDFENNGEKYFANNVLISIPSTLQSEFPQNLSQCVIRICTQEPYSWEVNTDVPNIDKNTTFQNLFDTWFKNLLT